VIRLRPRPPEGDPDGNDQEKAFEEAPAIPIARRIEQLVICRLLASFFPSHLKGYSNGSTTGLHQSQQHLQSIFLLAARA